MLFCGKGYSDFNRQVYDEIFAPLVDTYSHIATCAVDIEKIKEYPSFKDACNFLCDNDWDSLLFSYNSNIPRYFGLIAIQLLAAANRKNDELCTSKAYNPRLREFLNLGNENALQAKYRNAQEDIYANFEQWCRKNQIAIFLSKYSAHRFIQYPLSISLLHKEDISSLGAFFHQCGLAVNDELDLDDFRSVVRTRMTNLPNNIAAKIRNIEDARKSAIIAQMYSAYLDWDGTYTVNNTKRKSYHTPQSKHYAMYWGHEEDKAYDEPEFFCNGFSSTFKFAKEAFFVRDGSNDWSYIPDKKINCDIKSDLAFVFQTDSPRATKLSCLFANSLFKYRSINVIYIGADKIEKLYEIFGKDLGKNYSIRLSGGIKFGYRTWMTGTGPTIICEGKYPFRTVRLIKLTTKGSIINTVSLEEQPLINLESGKYYLRYAACEPAIYFEIQDASMCQVIKSKCHCGWIFKEGIPEVTNAIREEYVSGLNFSLQLPEIDIPQSEQCNAVQYWIRLATGGSEKKNTNENLTHKALRRSFDGIR